MESVIDFENVVEVENLVHLISVRRKFLAKHAIVCPKCKDRQVQLLEICMIPRWKCRHCNHKFRFEPIKEVNQEK